MCSSDLTFDGGTHAFSWNSRGHQGPRDLGTLPPGLRSEAHAVNRHGQIVGRSSIDEGNIYRAVLWERGEIYNLNDYLPPNGGWIALSLARGINDSGYIVGTGHRPRRQTPFLLVPLPRR